MKNNNLVPLLAVLGLAVTATVALPYSASAQGFSRMVHRFEDRIEFVEWAKQHPDWVAQHPDRYRFFLSHPGEAEKFRHEWFDWRSDRMQFAEWARMHPEWAEAHPDRYQFFIRHPEEAERYRHEWFEERVENERRSDRMQFREWAEHHPDWVANHPDRYRFFMSHPEKAEQFRAEWFDMH